MEQALDLGSAPTMADPPALVDQVADHLDRGRAVRAGRAAIDIRTGDAATLRSLLDRVRADYDGTGLTIGPHPMALRVRRSQPGRSWA